MKHCTFVKTTTTIFRMAKNRVTFLQVLCDQWFSVYMVRWVVCTGNYLQIMQYLIGCGTGTAYLGVTFDKRLTWKQHITHAERKPAFRKVAKLNQLSFKPSSTNCLSDHQVKTKIERLSRSRLKCSRCARETKDPKQKTEWSTDYLDPFGTSFYTCVVDKPKRFTTHH